VEELKIIKENWFTRKPREYLLSPTVTLTALLFAASLALFRDVFHAQSWMVATPQEVFVKHEYWRAWTTLFAHADISHLLSNALLYIPLVYLLTAYFGLGLFPWLGFFIGGLTNLIVLKTLPPEASLLGVSGVVYWMGAVWFTLFLLIDRRKNLKTRFSNVIFLLFMVFIPETYQPQISYLSHFLGFVFGVVSALAYYGMYRQDFLRAEVVETIREDDEMDDSNWTEDPFDDGLPPAGGFFH